jgi:hypothetical protein
MIRRWEKFMKMNGKLENAVLLRRAHEQKANEWHRRNKQEKTSSSSMSKPPYRYPYVSKRKSSESTSDYKSMDNSVTSASNTVPDPTEFDFTATLLKIKKEKTELELKELKQEQAEIMLQMKEEEITPQDSFDSQKLVIDENQNQDGTGENEAETEQTNHNNDMLFGEMTDIKLSATDISNEELIELFKDFETSSEDELEFVRQIMEEIEVSDKPRFELLKRAMEEIQNSYETVVTYDSKPNTANANNLLNIKEEKVEWDDDEW